RRGDELHPFGGGANRGPELEVARGGRFIEDRTKLAQAPAQTRSRVVRPVPQKITQARAELRLPARDQVREQRARLLPRWHPGEPSAEHDLQLAQQSDLESLFQDGDLATPLWHGPDRSEPRPSKLQRSLKRRCSRPRATVVLDAAQRRSTSRRDYEMTTPQAVD